MGSAWALPFGIAAFGLLMALPVLKLISLYAERVLSTGELAVGLVTITVFAAGLVASWGTALHWLLWCLLLVVSSAVVVLDRASRRKLRELLDEQDVESYQRALQFDAGNVDAHSRLGDVYLRRGQVDHAIAEYRAAVGLAPRDVREKRKLQKAIELKRRREARSVWCPKCRAENTPGAAYCAQCGFPLSFKRDLLDMLSSAETTRLASWAALGCLGAIILTVNIGLVQREVYWPILGVLLVLLAGSVLGWLGSRALARQRSKRAGSEDGKVS